MRAALCSVVATLGLALGLAYASNGLAAEGVPEYRVGQAVIYPLVDVEGDMPLDIFATPEGQPASAPKDAPDFKIPAGIKAFAIKNGPEVFLVDTGTGGPDSPLVENLARAGLAPEDVTCILLTHMHYDHIGGLVKDGQAVFPKAKLKVSRLEREFWLSEQAKNEHPRSQANFELARQVMNIYADQASTFEFAAPVAPGFTALDATGHTPGHTAFLLESGGNSLLFWGDIVHGAALQFDDPELCARYDMDPAEAVIARRAMMELAKIKSIPVAGAHLPGNGIGRVEQRGSPDAYVYIPMEVPR